MARPIPGIEGELERRIEALGMEMVELQWAGSDARPILRLRVDFPHSTPGEGVTVKDCVRVSRELEPWLDEHGELAEKYTLEVSSPGVERPLHRRRDYERFTGEEVAVKGDSPFQGARSRRVVGFLDGLEGEGEEFEILLRMKNGTVLRIPRREIVGAHLVFRWGDED